MSSEDRSDTVILTVELESGRFRSSLRVPLLPNNEAEREQHLKAWAELVQTGFRIGATEMTADLGSPRRRR